jgi:hypothetical protein
MAIRNTRKRDSRQWIIDYAVKEAGIEQNFEVGLRRYNVRVGGHGPFDSPIPDDYPWRW